MDPLETIAFAAKDLSSRVSLGTHTVAMDGPLTLAAVLTGLNGAAATLTLDVVVQRSSNDYAGDRYSRSKRDATSTRELMPALLQEAEAGDVIEVFAQSTNASDTSVSGEIVVRDAVAANVELWRKTQPNTLSSGAVHARIMSVQSNAIDASALSINAISASNIADGAITAAKVDQAVLDKVWGSATRTLSSFGSLVSDIASAVWSLPARTLTAGTRDAEIDAIKNQTDPFTFSGGDVVATLDGEQVSASNMRGTDDALLAANYTAPPSASTIAGAVWGASTRTLTSFGSLVSDVATAVWGATTRTLSAFGFTVATDTDSREASKADVSSVANDADMQTLLSRTAAGVTVTVGSHIADDKTTLKLTQGETYLASINNAISINLEDDRLEATIESDGTVPVLRIAPLKDRAGATLAINGTVADFDAGTSTATLKFEMTAKQSRSLRPGDNRYEIDLQLAGNTEHVLTPVVDAPCEVHKQIV